MLGRRGRGDSVDGHLVLAGRSLWVPSRQAIDTLQMRRRHCPGGPQLPAPQSTARRPNQRPRTLSVRTPADLAPGAQLGRQDAMPTCKMNMEPAHVVPRRQTRTSQCPRGRQTQHTVTSETTSLNASAETVEIADGLLLLLLLLLLCLPTTGVHTHGGQHPPCVGCICT